MFGTVFCNSLQSSNVKWLNWRLIYGDYVDTTGNFLKLKTVPNYSTLDTLITEEQYSTTCGDSKTESKEEQVNFNSFSYAWSSAMLFVEP